MTKNRLYGLDILRILSITLITIIHFISYTNILTNDKITNFNYVTLNILSSFTVVAINVFILITGFFSCEKKINIKRIIKLWFHVILISLFLLFISYLTKNGYFSVTTIIKSLFPVTTMHYWFFSIYLILCLLQPLLNVLIKNIDKKMHFLIVVIGMLLFTVYFVLNPFINSLIYIAGIRGVLWFIYLYVVGAFIKKYDIKISKKIALPLIILLLFVVFLLKYFNIDTIKNSYLLEENSLIPFLLSVLLFIVFKDIDIKNKMIKDIIMKLSACSFFVYIIQEHDAIRYWFWNFFNINSYASSFKLILILILSIFILWIIAFLLYYILKLIDPLFDKIYSYFEGKVNKTIKNGEQNETK